MYKNNDLNVTSYPYSQLNCFCFTFGFKYFIMLINITFRNILCVSIMLNKWLKNDLINAL